MANGTHETIRLNGAPPSLCPQSILYGRNLVQQEREGVHLLIDPVAPNWVSANDLGALVLRRCDGRHTLAELSLDLAASHGLSQEQVSNYIEEMVQAEMVATAPDLAPPYPGRAHAIGPSVLEELWINTNQSCTLRCRHCLVDAGIEPAPPLSAAEIEGLVEQALALGLKRVYFTGGEPFLRQDIISLIDFVTRRADLVVLTSGVLLTPELAQDLRRAGRDRLLLQVSLEGPDASSNDAIRGQGSFALALSGIQSLLQAGLKPVVTTTLTRLNYEKAAATTRFLARLGITDQHVLWLHERGRSRSGMADLLLSGEEVARTMAEVRDAAEEVGVTLDNAVSLALRVHGGRGRKYDLCNSCYGILNVNSDGRAYPCAALTGVRAFDCGSVKEKGLKEVWLGSAAARQFRENSVEKRVGCSTCFLKYFCGGGCQSQSYLSYETATGSGCIMAPDPYCRVYRNELMHYMWKAALPPASERSEDGPRLYRAMRAAPPACTQGGYRVLNAAHAVSTFHCSCVLTKT